MAVKKRTTEEFRQQMFNKYNGKVEIIGEYLGASEPIEFLYHCEKHGDIITSMNAKNISSNKSFQPCEECMRENKSKSNGVGRSKMELFNEFKTEIENKGGKLLETEWIKSKYLYTIKCNNDSHPKFKMSHDAIMNKGTWCPYCYGREGNFQEEIEDIIKSRNGTLLSNYNGSSNHVRVRCNIHNYEWDIMPLNLKKGKWCYICNMPKYEVVPYNTLVELGYKVEPQYKFNDLNGFDNELLKFDFAVFNNDEFLFLVEIDDEEHRYNHTGNSKRSIERRRAIERDSIKDKYCNDNGIKLIRIEIYTKDYKINHEEKYREYFLQELNRQLEGFDGIKRPDSYL